MAIAMGILCCGCGSFADPTMPDASSSTTDAGDDGGPAAPGVTVDPRVGLVTTEAGGSATFTLVLNTQPEGDVTIALVSNDPSEGNATPSEVTFTSANWDSPQTVSVVGVDDTDSDGDVTYSIVTDDAESTADAVYDGMSVADAIVTNTDDD